VVVQAVAKATVAILLNSSEEVVGDGAKVVDDKGEKDEVKE
jgi:hypothetical protein